MQVQVQPQLRQLGAKRCAGGHAPLSPRSAGRKGPHGWQRRKRLGAAHVTRWLQHTRPQAQRRCPEADAVQ